MSLRTIIGAGLLAAGGWLYSRQAAAAPVDPPASSDPAMLDPEPAPYQPAANTPAAFLAIVRQVNDAEYGGWFDPALVMGVMQTESSFNPRAYRYEPSRGEASYGLMQLLESTARDRGLVGSPELLYDPALNIRLGMAQLKWSYDYLAGRLGTVTTDQWLSSYNAGVGYVANGGLRLAYIGKVKGYAASWSGVA